MKSKSYRCIYCVEAFDKSDYVLVARQYFRNKRSAERAVGTYAKCGYACYVRKLGKYEHRYVNPDYVEG